jgi:hypothetical protein
MRQVHEKGLEIVLGIFVLLSACRRQVFQS